MIQLFANSHELLLPDDFSFTLISENSLITNNGEFTLDIELSLLETINSKAFGHIERLNKVDIPKSWDGKIIIDVDCCRKCKIGGCRQSAFTVCKSRHSG